MKAPAYQMYAAEWLADEMVTLMSLEAEGAYIRLLNYCWREGTIPAEPKLLSRMAKHAPLEVIEEVLGCFHSAPDQPGRLVHKRLEEERAKQAEFRQKQSDRGKLGGRPPKATGKPEESHGFIPAKPEESQPKPGDKPARLSSSSSTSSSTTSNEVGRTHEEDLLATAPLPAKEESKAVPVSAPRRTEANDDDQSADESPLAKPVAFAAILKGLYPAIDYDYYRNKMLVKAPEGKLAVRSWRNWIIEFMERELKDARREGKELVTPATAPDHNEVPTNAPLPVPMAATRIEEPILNTAFVGQQQANRQAQSVARLQVLATAKTLPS